MTKEQKEWIDNASYQELLYKWRFAPSDNPMFKKDTGEYYSKVLTAKRTEIGATAAVQASKNIGWTKQ